MLGGLTATLANAGEPELATRLQQGGHVLMMRHAHAPGFGDPPGFKLDDCTTQRNLDSGGRAQATAIGDWLRRQGVREALVYSSLWCRNIETARLLDLGPVTPLPALNSFFEREQDRVGILVALNAFLTRQPIDGPLLILVTHFVNIEAVAGTGVGSGKAVLLQLQAGASPRVIGPVDFKP
jgi:phosphohistidine phosphatase SixA